MVTVPPLGWVTAVTLRTPPSGSLSLASTLRTLFLLPSATDGVSFLASGGSGRLFTVTVTVAVSLPPLLSVIV
jgi:hypothetical protein